MQNNVICLMTCNLSLVLFPITAEEFKFNNRRGLFCVCDEILTSFIYMVGF